MLNQIQKSPDLHIHSIPGLQAQPVEQPCSRRGREFNMLNMREQPPGHSPASAPQPHVPFLDVSFRQKLMCPPLFRAPHISFWQRNTIFLAAGGDLETMEITHWLFFNTKVMWHCQNLTTIRLERAQLCSIDKLEKSTGKNPQNSSWIHWRRASQGESQIWPCNLKNNLIYM